MAAMGCGDAPAADDEPRDSVQDAVSAGATATNLEAEEMTLAGTATIVRADAAASGGKTAYFWANGSASASFEGAATRITIWAKATLCNGSPTATLSIDGVDQPTATVSSTTYQAYAFAVSLKPGTHTLKLTYANDFSSSSCDRNLAFDRAVLERPAPPVATTNPFAGAKLYVDPNHKAVATIAQWEASGRRADAQQLRKISTSAQSPYYLAEWTEKLDGIEFYVNYYATKWAADGSLPVFGAYALPHRDCGSFSAGGFTSAGQYRAWIDGYARGIGTKKVVVVLEPDGLAGMSCLDATQQKERMDLIKYAVTKLKAQPNAHVYIDAGNSTWQSVQTITDRLKQSGIETADGFAVNNANFNATSDEIAYGKKIAAGVQGKHFIVDTSRNGLGRYTGGTHDGNCAPQFNPPGRALGARPTANTGEPLVDAFYWLKSPGASDGACGPFPAAGAWVPEYALGLAQRATYSASP
jgi:endoglucanase